MNLKRAKNYRRSLKWTTGLIRANPVASLGMALPFIIVPAVSLKAAVMMSILIFAATLPCAVISAVLGDRVKPIYAVPLYSIISMLFVTAAKLSMREQAVIFDVLGLYIPLVAINSIMIELSAAAPRRSWAKALKDAVMTCLGFAAVCCLIGALREVFGYQTIWGYPFKLYSVRLIGVALPFFGFIMIGFLAAFFRSIDRGVMRTMLAIRPSYNAQSAAEAESAGENA